MTEPSKVNGVDAALERRNKVREALEIAEEIKVMEYEHQNLMKIIATAERDLNVYSQSINDKKEELSKLIDVLKDTL